MLIGVRDKNSFGWFLILLVTSLQLKTFGYLKAYLDKADWIKKNLQSYMLTITENNIEIKRYIVHIQLLKKTNFHSRKAF